MNSDLSIDATDINQYNDPKMNWQKEGDSNSPQRQFMRRKIALQSKEVAGKRILDVGCGSGWFLADCKELGAQKLVGLEPSRYAKMAQKNVPEATIYQQRLEDFQANAASFDFISFIMSTEHIQDAKKLFTRSKTLLSENGILLILTADFTVFQEKRFDYTVTTQKIIAGKEHISRTERPSGFGTTTDFLRSVDYWQEVALEAGFDVVQHTPMYADEQFVAQVPKHTRHLNRPFMHVFRFQV